ncbi:cytochrome b/b6 domain-containing protein [sulfur-oxidizing endosymbiont of Gigantopelta aegis]|uniref:cytochrome b/b6 domain-containing protein n=1 Tax=sulfur-oxidizing endosymbiont of Gigantopelta aegis TaxID=2794934 RepID=UPI0018DD191E|nr:cytochrome b/b6 domain-containing protein [sulfur-oxidizing endosymbiont of Gigantopelta aegis]
MVTGTDNTIKVWDILIRGFHWILVISFFTAYLSEDDFLDIHIYAGYLIAGLLVFRLIWGFIGSHYARFSDFIYSPRVVIDYTKSLLSTEKPKRYIGHNPAGGLMIVLLLLSLFITTVSGLVMDDEIESVNSNETNSSMVYFDADDEDKYESDLYEVMEEVHEFFANLTLLLVFLHVAGVIVSGKLHDENLVRAMITGKKTLEKDE